MVVPFATIVPNRALGRNLHEKRRFLQRRSWIRLCAEPFLFFCDARNIPSLADRIAAAIDVERGNVIAKNRLYTS